jgi:uncharacterized membrane protein
MDAKQFRIGLKKESQAQVKANLPIFLPLSILILSATQYTVIYAEYHGAFPVIMASVFNVLAFLCDYFYLKTTLGVADEKHMEVEDLLNKEQMAEFPDWLLTWLLTGLKVALWSLLFVIPGIYKLYEYAMVPYLIVENPGMKYKDAYEKSHKMMEGHRWELFVLQFTFIPWFLLAAVTFGLSNVYTMAYYEQTMTDYYKKRLAETDAAAAEQPKAEDGVKAEETVKTEEAPKAEDALKTEDAPKAEDAKPEAEEKAPVNPLQEEIDAIDKEMVQRGLTEEQRKLEMVKTLTGEEFAKKVESGEEHYRLTLRRTAEFYCKKIAESGKEADVEKVYHILKTGKEIPAEEG